MSLRKSACASCVAAKRRCDRELPACHRCTKRAEPCLYPYLPKFNNSIQAIPTYESPGVTLTGPDVALVPNVVGPGHWDSDELLDMSPDGALRSFELASGSEMVYLSPLQLGVTSAYSGTAIVTSPESEQLSSGVDGGPIAPSDTKGPGQETPSCSLQAIFKAPQLTKTLSYVWPRASELDTWAFCASELLTYVNLFAQGVTTPFISLPTDSPLSRPIYFPPPLRTAYGVCATYTTLTTASQPFFEQILDEEVDNLIGSSRFFPSTGTTVVYGDSNFTGLGNPVDTFREHLSRVQTMILYYLIRAFGCSSRQRLLAEQLDPLLAAWTVELQLRLQLLDKQRSVTAGSDNKSQDLSSTTLRPEEWQSIHRTILVSYLARSVYTILKYKTHPLLEELASLPVLTPATSGKVVTYHEFAEIQNPSSVAGGIENDRFTNLLLVACWGLTVKTNVSWSGAAF